MNAEVMKSEQKRLNYQARLLDRVSDAIIATNSDFRIEAWNRAAERIYGYTAREALGQNVGSLLDSHFMTGEHTEEVLESFRKSGHWEGVVQQRHKDGSRVEVLASVTANFDEEGKPSGVVAVNRDISERKLVERERDEALAEKKTLLEATQAVLEESDFQCAARRIFDSCRRFTGAAAGYVALRAPVGDHCDVVHFEPRGAECCVDLSLSMPIRGLSAEAYRRGQTVYDNRFEKSDHTAVFPVGVAPLENVLLAPLILEDDVVGLLGLLNKPGGFTDRDALMASAFGKIAATALRNSRTREALQRLNAELERRVERRTAELKASNAELESFAYSVSHDLRAPLRSIDGFSKALLEDYGGDLDDIGLDHLSRVRASAKRMEHLIDSLLHLSRLNQTEINWCEVDLTETAASVVGDLRQQEPDRKVEVDIQKSLNAWGDPDLLRAVLENLTANSWKFTRGKSEARIEFGRAQYQGKGCFFIRDNGVGFDMEYVGKLFNAFQRLHDARQFPGTGIGLATVRRIIRRHGGDIWAEAKVDRGATFWFTLPGSGFCQ